MRTQRIEDALRDIHSLPEVVAATELHTRLQETVKQLQRSLSDARDVPGDSDHPASVEDDVASLLAAGGDVAVLTGPSPEAGRQHLVRQVHAVEKALEAAEQRRNQAVLRACQAELERLRPLLEGEYSIVISHLEGLLASLRRWEHVVDELGRHGLTGLVVSAWSLTPMESGFLHSQSPDNLERYIRARRRATGLERK